MLDIVDRVWVSVVSPEAASNPEKDYVPDLTQVHLMSSATFRD